MTGKHSLGKAGLIIFCALLCVALVNPAAAACPVSWRDKNLTYTRACTMIDAFDNLSQVDPWMVSNTSRVIYAELINRTSDFNSLLISEALNRSVDKAATILEMENQQAANDTHTANEIYIGTDLNLTRSASGEAKNISEGNAAVLSTVSDWIQDLSNKTAPYSPTGYPAAYNISNQSGMVNPPLYDVNGTFDQFGYLIYAGDDFGIQPNTSVTLTGLYFRARALLPPGTCEAPFDNVLQWKLWRSPPSDPILLGNTSACDIPFGDLGDKNINRTWIGLKFDHPILVTPGDIIGFHDSGVMLLPSLIVSTGGITTGLYDNNLPFVGDFQPGGSIRLYFSGIDVMGSTEDPAITARIAEDVSAAGDASTLAATLSAADTHLAENWSAIEAIILTNVSSYSLTTHSGGSMDINADGPTTLIFGTGGPSEYSTYPVTMDYISFAMKKVSEGSAVWTVTVRNITTYTLITTLGTVDLSSLSGTYQWVQFPASPSEFTVGIGEEIALAKTSGDGNKAKVRWNNAGRYDTEIARYIGSDFGFGWDSLQNRLGYSMAPTADYHIATNRSEITEAYNANITASDAVVENRVTVGVETNASIMEDRITVGTSANITAAFAPLTNNGSVTFNNGTDMPIYNLTASWTEILGTSQSLNFTTPNAGSYLVEADIRENWTLDGAADRSHSTFALCDATGTAIVTGSERMGTMLQSVSGGLPSMSHHYSWVYTNSTGATQVKVCGVLDTEPAGEWAIISDADGRTTLNYVRLA